MKKYLIVVATFLSLTAFTVVNSVWKSDPPHSQLGFTITHLGINDVSGTFNDFEATVTSSKPDFSDASFVLNAKAASIDTRVEARNNHLKSGDFFDVKKYPDLSFKSTKVTKSGKDKLKITGDLTLHGITKSVTLDAIYRGTVENPMSKKQTVGFQVTGIVKCSDFNVGPNFPSTMISDEVHIKADAEFVQ